MHYCDIMKKELAARFDEQFYLDNTLFMEEFIKW